MVSEFDNLRQKTIIVLQLMIGDPLPYAKMERDEFCPPGSEITNVDDCRDAVGYASALGITLGARTFAPANGAGNWGHVPSGCSYQDPGDQAFHFNQKVSSNGLHEYKLICWGKDY